MRRPRQASPRALAIAGGVVGIAVIAIVLGVVLSGSKKPNASTIHWPPIGSATWHDALSKSTDIRKLFKGIPQSGLTLGSPNAPATLTEFIDLQCPLCMQFETQQFPTIVQRYVRTGKLNVLIQPWEILDRPGGPGDSARGQAATIAASLQNKAFQFAELLYFNQGVEDSGWLTSDMVGRAASSVDEMDPRRVLDDLGSSQVKAIVRQVDSTASSAGFNGTPTLLLNHKGRNAHVVSVGVPNAATFLSQIQSAIKG